MLDAMMDGDGFWDISADDLSNMAADISAAAGL